MTAHTARVLVVDDDRAVRSVLQVHLRKEGMHVTAVQDPAAAMSALRSAATPRTRRLTLPLHLADHSIPLSSH